MSDGIYEVTAWQIVKRLLQSGRGLLVTLIVRPGGISARVLWAKLNAAAAPSDPAGLPCHVAPNA